MIFSAAVILFPRKGENRVFTFYGNIKNKFLSRSRQEDATLCKKNGAASKTHHFFRFFNVLVLVLICFIFDAQHLGCTCLVVPGEKEDADK